MECKKSSLHSQSVFILDSGHSIYQWNGSESLLSHRLKARLICSRINAHERKGRTRFLEMDQQDSPVQEFYDLLLDSNSSFPLQDADELEEDWIPPILYSPKESSLDHSNPSDHSDHSNPSELKLKLQDYIYTKHNLKKSHLLSNSVYILDANTQIFLWIGKDSHPTKRILATELLTKIISSEQRPPWLGMFKCFENHEPEIFKLYFSDWELQSNFEHQLDHSKTGIKMDVQALLSPPPSVSMDLEFIKNTMAHMDSILVKMNCFVFEKGKYVTLSDSLRGNFYIGDAYIYLCMYQSLKMDDEQENSGLECVLYFWKGRKAPKRAFATFKFTTQIELQELIQSMYQLPIKIVHIEQGKEPLSFLSHVSNRVLYHQGTLKSHPSTLFCIYHLHLDSKYGTIRAYQLSSKLSSKRIHLNSHDAYLCIGLNSSLNSAKNVLWIGKDLQQLEEFKEASMKLIHPSTDLEISQEDSFWNSFQNQMSISGPLNGKPKDPRFFKCSCSLGFFSIEEIPLYTQQDLRPDTCCVLEFLDFECTDHSIFLWRGKEASEVVYTLTLKSIYSKLNQGQDSQHWNIRESQCLSGYFSDSDAPKQKETHLSSSHTLISSRSRSFSSLKSPTLSRKSSQMDQIDTKDPVEIVHQGLESPLFISFFHGWDDSFESIEPSNHYLDSLNKSLENISL